MHLTPHLQSMFLCSKKKKLVRKGVIWYKNQACRVKHKKVMADKQTRFFLIFSPLKVVILSTGVELCIFLIMTGTGSIKILATIIISQF